MGDSERPVMFADCLHEIDDEELRKECARVLPLPPSVWRTAILDEMIGRGFSEEPHEPRR